MMIDNQNKLTLLINSCDGYRDTWELFFSALEEYWEKHPKVILNTESNQDLSFKNVLISYLSPQESNFPWAKRLKKSVDKVQTELVLLTFDDYILESYVDNDEISKVIELMEKNENIAVVYLIHTDLDIEEVTLLQGNSQNKYYKIKDRTPFKLNSAPAIWRKSCLKNFTGDIEDPWAWEVFGTYKTYDSKYLFYTVSETDKDVYPYDYKKGGAIYRSKWVKSVVEDKILKYGLSIDINTRGYIEDAAPIKRSLKWKIGFLLQGMRMVDFKMYYFFRDTIKAKLK